MDQEAKKNLSITVRPVVSGDYDFLLEVYASTRADEMAMVPWTDEQKMAFVRSQFNAQQEHYERKYPTASHDVILSNGRQVGRIYVARLEKEIRIVDITLLQSERNSRIGSCLLKQLLRESQLKGTVTRIYVEEFNPSLSLFRRLGFNVTEQEGFHLLMEYTPAAATGSVG